MRASDHRLRLVRAEIDTYQQPVVYMHRDCAVCRSEGFAALTRVLVRSGGREVVATLNVVSSPRFPLDTAALSEAAWRHLEPAPEAMAEISHPEPPASAPWLRAKVFGQELEESAFLALMQDVVSHRLSEIELAAFVTACAGERLTHREIVALTKAMVAVGQRLDWGSDLVLDKHSVGGLPGNRTTPIVVAIVAAAGYRIPKTSSRAITSPAGTADVMEVMTPVALDRVGMQRVVEREGGCLVWGGHVGLSPADDMLIRVERPLDFDSNGQLVASVLSKKVAAGSTHVLIDMPVGPSAKVRSVNAADALEMHLLTTGQAVGLALSVLRTDGSQPVGRGIGPALEAQDVLRVLRTEPGAPQDLRHRSIDVAAALLDLVPDAVPGSGRSMAIALLDNGGALAKFQAICEAQGGFTEPPTATHHAPIVAPRSGRVLGIDNRQLAQIAKLAGAPSSPTAGLICHVRLGDSVAIGAPTLTVHAGSQGELAYALAFAAAHPRIIELGEET